MEWVGEHWDTIAPIVLAVLGIVAAWLQRQGKKEALAVATTLISVIEKLNSADIKKAAKAESILKGVAKPLAALVTKVTNGGEK